MATKVKVTQKELKKPDKFLEFIDRSTNYLAESYKLIVYFVGAIIALILIFFLINSYQNKNTSKANIIYKEGITAKTSGDFDTALTKFGILQKDYSGQKVSDLSLYYTGSIYYNREDYDNSLTYVSKFLNTGPKDPNMIDAAYSLISLSYLNKGEYQLAIDFANRISNPDSPYIDNAQMTKGLALEKLGKHDEATEIYNKILTTMYPGTFQPQ